MVRIKSLLGTRYIYILRGTTRSCRTRVLGGSTRTGPPRHRSGFDPQPAGYFGLSTRVPVWQRVPVVSMPDKNFQKPFNHAANDPTRYSHNTYQVLRMKLRRPSMIMSISGRVPGYSLKSGTQVHGYPGTRSATCPRCQHA